MSHPLNSLVLVVSYFIRNFINSYSKMAREEIHELLERCTWNIRNKSIFILYVLYMWIPVTHTKHASLFECSHYKVVEFIICVYEDVFTRSGR